MLQNASFVRWANEHLVVFFVHNELGHEPERVVGEDGEVEERCPLYPGLTCRDHVDGAVDVDVARDDRLVRIPFVELCPNTWLVTPDGEVHAVSEEDQFRPGRIRAQAEALQASLESALPPEAWPPARGHLETARLAADEDRHGDALRALAALAAAHPKPPASLRALVDARMETIDEVAGWDLEDVLADESLDEAARRRALEALAEALAPAPWGTRVPTWARVVAAMEEEADGR